MEGVFTVFFGGAALIFLSALLFFKKLMGKFYDWLIFSTNASPILLGIGGGWFLGNVLHLSPADFGDHRVLLFSMFSTVILLSFFKMRDLLAVRGLAVLLLVLSNFALTSVYCTAIPRKNFFVTFAYLVVIFAMTIGTFPYLMRDSLAFLLKSKVARMATGMCTFAYGVLLLWVSIAPASPAKTWGKF
jgi:hypothetical protein